MKQAVAVEPRIGDALGMAVLAHDEGRSGLHVLERDDGWIHVMDSSVYFREPGGWPEGEPQALDHVRGRVLDIGAGAGRYAIQLQQAGHDVLALDTSRGAVEVCRRRGVEDVLVGTVNEVAAEQRFDTFLLGGNNIGLLAGPDDGPRILEHLRRLASPGARVVGTYQDTRSVTDPDLLAYHDLNRGRGRLAGQLRFRVRFGAIATTWFDYWHPDPEDLRSAADSAGWQVVHDEELAFGSRLAVLNLR